jgi:hypothetical protein
MTRVDLNRPSYHAQLHLLGDGRDGRQWALITWQQRVSIDSDGGTMPYAAWCPLGKALSPTVLAMTSDTGCDQLVLSIGSQIRRVRRIL